MVKLCGQSIVKPLSITFKNCTDNGIFPDIQKKSNITPAHKKGDKQIIDNYRPVPLLPICVYFFLNYYSIQYLNLLMIKIFSVLISQDSDQQIPVNINFFQWPMIFMHHLTVVHLFRLGVYFWTYPKHLIKSDMKA